MRGRHVAWYLLLVAMVVVSGCEKKRGLVGRWDIGSSNFYFRADGVVFYLAPSKTRYQGRYSYDDSGEPGILRAELQAINGNRQLSLEYLVTFLGPDRVRFERTNGGRVLSLLAARMEEKPRE